MVHTPRVVTIITALSLTPLFASPAPAGPAPTPIARADARAAFEKLRAIAGTWTFTTDSDHGTVSYELVSNGTAILERVMNEEHGETGMVSVVYLDGDRLILQHYCSSGNQPRLVSPGLEGDEIRFTFEGASNLASADSGHIHGAVFSFAGPGPFASRWTWRENGVDTTTARRHAR
jgi:hypothetical protein